MAGDQSSRGREAKSTRRWTFEEKLRVVSAAATMSEAELGAFLRREGLHEAQLAEWRGLVQAALDTPKKPSRRGASAEAKKIKALEKELRRKEKALAEVAALLALKKKADALWGDEDESTPSRSDDT
jgi:transposase-like protein